MVDVQQADDLEDSLALLVFAELQPFDMHKVEIEADCTDFVTISHVCQA